ncbi:MAG: hypothetical protein R2699_03240 [Acidimicrobiales bacterium]
MLAEQRFSGDVPSDAVCVGAVDLVLPNALGPVEVALTLTGDGVHGAPLPHPHRLRGPSLPSLSDGTHARTSCTSSHLTTRHQ